MILIDSIYINNSGGKALLDYLVDELEKTGDSFFYLFDLRCSRDYAHIPNERKVYLKPSISKRHSFYRKNKNKFSKVFCFGNLPPSINLNVPVFTYLHQRMYLSVPENLSLKQKLLLFFKTQVFKKLLKNTDCVIVQSESMKSEFVAKYQYIQNDSILVYPFYEKLEYPSFIERKKNRFIYVSAGYDHKNHKRLLEAFVKFYDQHKTGELALTISDEFIDLKNMINQLIAKGYPINNLGYLAKSSLGIEYSKSEFCIFPSLLESFGLGIVEAIEGGCKIIGSDLPYMYAACNPSLTFNPLDVNSIVHAMESIIRNNLPDTKQRIHNEIFNLVTLLKN